MVSQPGNEYFDHITPLPALPQEKPAQAIARSLFQAAKEKNVETDNVICLGQRTTSFLSLFVNSF